MSRKIDLVGKKFGNLEVLKEDFSRKGTKAKSAYWFCKCTCGNIKSINSWHLKSGKTISCGCKIKEVGNKKYNWSGYEEISGTFWRYIEDRKFGKYRNPIEVNITKEYIWELFLKQNRKCALTGMLLTFSKSQKDKSGTASLDRIDSSKGYIVGNIQWVHKDINWMKNTFSQEYFIELCKLVAANDVCELPQR